MYAYGCQRIGHGGASALAPANTLASFDAALEVGVDMVEFDVRAYHGELILAHTDLSFPPAAEPSPGGGAGPPGELRGLTRSISMSI